MKGADVVLAGHQHPAAAYARESIAGWVRSQASKSCTLTRWNSSTDCDEVPPGRHHLGHVEPVALHQCAIGGQREHPVHDHVVGHQVDEDLGLTVIA